MSEPRNQGSSMDKQTEQYYFKRLVLKPLVTAYAALVVGRLISGGVRGAGAHDNGRAKAFVEKNSENYDLVRRLAARQHLTPEDFAGFADANDTMQEDDVHNTTDEMLIKKATELRAAGALRLFREDLPWQCSIINNIEALLQCLPKAPVTLEENGYQLG
ncbi:hypothetical protein TSOC_006136 [Tetrabaena socialis]|uniref:Uncharacterized protein n=1 Tax=Tetrabaena socialis TaxID=47790 RepID=A0A2J8A4G8_9CHLO|nr:hypothetical protein TSOC_006136 [Tetrabaena socialis]|eukprot:PNH07409.1 hypothetical protein TSOC_006136 [Tetrabaena socialis]